MLEAFVNCSKTQGHRFRSSAIAAGAVFGALGFELDVRAIGLVIID